LGRNAIPSYTYDVALLAFIFFYGVICNFGWISVWFDAIYIYLWPFILIFKGLYLSIKYLWQKHVSVQAPPAATVASNPAPKAEVKLTVWNRVTNTFAQFALLWCAIILNTHSPTLTIIATAAAILGAGKAVYGLWDFISSATSWIEKLKGSFAEQLAKSIKAIRDWDEVGQSTEVTNAANLLKMAEKTCDFIADKKSILVRLTSIMALLITIPFYLYISAVFACAYLGIAKVEHLGLDFKTAMTDSLFVPIAFTDLPHSVWIRMIAGIQALTIGAMGYNILFRHFNNKIDRLSVAADELRQPLKDQRLMQRVVVIANLPKPQVVATTETLDPAMKKKPRSARTSNSKKSGRA